MTNLLQETIDDINLSGHTPNDIVFIGSQDSGHSCTWEEFQVLADKEYDSGFGAQKVANDLIIAFNDGSTMWRDEYDGSEKWEYSLPFKTPDIQLPITRLIGNYWASLDTLQGHPDGHYIPFEEEN